MTPRTLSSKISKLPAKTPITTEFERDLRRPRIRGKASVWYSTQKEHWLGWLKEYRGPGYYGRKNWNRDAEFVYNHIVCPPMVLWLGEASGVSLILVRKAKSAALSAGPSPSAQSAAIRSVVPWKLIQDRLLKSSENAPVLQPTMREVPGRCAAEVPELIGPLSFTEHSVYAIVDRKRLDRDFERQEPSAYEEGRGWSTAARILEKARITGDKMPVLFGNADDCSKLSHWGLLSDIQVHDGNTSYTVDRLRKIAGKHSPQDLVLRSTGRNIAPNFIKSYAICKTPEFLLGNKTKRK